ncbi:hypothetical protein [uncultured Roseobacter sp.]|uniref:hypothetical protein n=1 Tax=uncultured Roseobacter sp. TaxID=114847 RepID=UPI00262AADEC|nr:hypothetical protein [uncultured Roseobacter sp.]
MAIKIDSDTGNISAGGDNTDGDLLLNSNSGQRRIHLDAGSGNAYLGGNGADGDLLLMPSGASSQSGSSGTIHMSGDSGNYRAGGNGADGDVTLQSTEGQNRIRLDGGGGNAWLGGNGADGDLVLFASDGDNATLAASTIHMNGEEANYRAGGNGADGDITLQSTEGENRIRLDAGGGNMWIGGNGADGDIVVFASTGDNSTLANATIHINGDAGDIVMQNADFAEEFDICEASPAVEPGDVMVMGRSGALEPCRSAYDARAVGIVSGAGDYRPGIVLDRQVSAGMRLPVALVGKVFVKADASHGAIAVGDMLTTSPTFGHAMRASDRARAFGATLGKAMAPLDDGTGMIPVLVNLQ